MLIKSVPLLFVGCILLIGSRAAAQAGSFPIPAYPGTAPASYASAADYEEYALWRAGVLGARANWLTDAGRPKNYRLLRWLAMGATIAGAAVFAVGALDFTESDSSYDLRYARNAMIGGGSLAIAGGTALGLLASQVKYTDEITELKKERRYWLDEATRLGRERLPYGMTPYGRGIQLRMQF